MRRSVALAHFHQPNARTGERDRERDRETQRETERERARGREGERDTALRFRLRNTQRNTRQETCQQSFNKDHTHTPYNTRPGKAYDRASNPAILFVRGLHKALWLLAEIPAVLHRAEVVRIYGRTFTRA